MKRALVVASLALGCHGGTAAPDRASTAVAHHGEVVDRVVLTGVVHPTTAIEIAVPATTESTLAIRWLIADGTIVKAGDRVLVFDDTPFTARLLESRTQLTSQERQFKLNHGSAANTLRDKAATIRAAEIAHVKAKLQADLPADLVTARAAQDNRFRLAQAAADLTKAKEDLVTTTAVLALEERVREIDLERTRRSIAAAEEALPALQIVAPADGFAVVSESPSDGHTYKVGESVEAGQTILTEPDLAKPMEVRAELNGADDGRIALAMRGTCTLDAYPADPIACTVIELSPVSRPPAGHDSVRRSFGVTLSLAHGDPARLRPGMSVKVELAQPHLAGLVIPRSAVTSPSVRLGPCDAQQCIVTSGLVEGDVVETGGGS